MDRLAPKARSALMARIRSTGSDPELLVRRLTHRLGFRFRIHRRDLPGTPDLVFPRLRRIIFVHGCFWHGHPGCRRAHLPATRREYWLPKLARNAARDANAQAALKAAGWDILVVWECETGDLGTLERRLTDFLSP
jgi:DNA mismatch endonuclease (patch repair protein)